MIVKGYSEDNKKTHLVFCDESNNKIYCVEEKNSNYIITRPNTEEILRTIKYSQKFISPGFKVFDKENNILIRGTESIFHGCKLDNCEYLYNTIMDAIPKEVTIPHESSNIVLSYELSKNDNVVCRVDYNPVNNPFCTIDTNEVYLLDSICIYLGLRIINTRDRWMES